MVDVTYTCSWIWYLALRDSVGGADDSRDTDFSVLGNSRQGCATQQLFRMALINLSRSWNRKSGTNQLSQNQESNGHTLSDNMFIHDDRNMISEIDSQIFVVCFLSKHSEQEEYKYSGRIEWWGWLPNLRTYRQHNRRTFLYVICPAKPRQAVGMFLTHSIWDGKVERYRYSRSIVLCVDSIDFSVSATAQITMTSKHESSYWKRRYASFHCLYRRSSQKIPEVLGIS